MFLWTSEAVSKGHPDKVADQIADSVLDAYLEVDPLERVACEVTCCKELVLVTGEVSSRKKVDVEKIVRQRLIDIGYDRPAHSYDGHTVRILDHINRQSDQIAAAVSKADGEIGAGDQGIMFGYACHEAAAPSMLASGVRAFMPLAHHLAFRVINALEADRASLGNSPLLPDAKSQITIAYEEDGLPSYIDTVLVSTQHKDGMTEGDLYGYLENLVKPLLLESYPQMVTPQTKWLYNPAGLWTLGGPAADTGLSGRKIVVDNYGADCPIGGGSFSGKDPTKVDRSAAYAARHVAKNIVAADLAGRCQVQLSYAIGVVEPVSIRIQTFDTGVWTDERFTDLVRDTVKLSPKAIIDRFNLRRPIYAATASGGHFGREGFPWEELDLVDVFKGRVHR